MDDDSNKMDHDLEMSILFTFSSTELCRCITVFQLTMEHKNHLLLIFPPTGQWACLDLENLFACYVIFLLFNCRSGLDIYSSMFSGMVCILH